MKKQPPTPITAPLTTTTLSEVVAADLGITTEEAYHIVVTVFSAIGRALIAGHKVAVTNFGTFLPYRTKKRNSRNPQTGESLIAPAHRAIRFRISPTLSAAVRTRTRRFSIRKQPKRTAAAAATGSK
ncbi:HU family DNA-binding protein [Streptomyces sp. NPDC001914]|uniref:HU family DNA-binding protein n=1 Tax=Streptomyces sp. NPDC001914 TaxID=3364623 RepID=UPI0036B65F6D